MKNGSQLPAANCRTLGKNNGAKKSAKRIKLGEANTQNSDLAEYHTRSLLF